MKVKKKAEAPENIDLFYQADDIRRYFMGIFERQYYTESGPLVQVLEKTLQDELRIKNIICVSNASISWLMLLGARFEGASFVIPQDVSRPLNEAIKWHRADYTSYYGAEDFLELRNDSFNNSAVLVLNEKSIVKFRESVHANALNLPAALIDTEYVNFSQLKTLSRTKVGIARVLNFETGETDFGCGACICTDNDDLADELRCMRGSGGVRKKVPVKRTVNGRMSEAQAAFVLMRAEKQMNLNFVDNVSS